MKIAILTNFQDLKAGYSLTGIVKDQAEMLAKHGNEVILYVSEAFRGDTAPKGSYKGEVLPKGMEIRKTMPHTPLTDYQTMTALKDKDRPVIGRIRSLLVAEMADVDIVITHDFLHTGWNLIYGIACVDAAKLLDKPRWFHWVHSIPTQNRDWWNMKWIDGGQKKHKMVYPNKADQPRCARAYRCELDEVVVFPHIKDIRTFCDFDDMTKKFIDSCPAVMQADAVEIMPASSDRLQWKRVREVILIFAELKRQGLSVFLAVANQWANTAKRQADLEQFEKIAQRNGLEVGKEFIFTSRWDNGAYSAGLPKRILRELLMLQNLFIFPTHHESFGLCPPEAMLVSNCLMVLNGSLKMQPEVAGGHGLYFDFGSYDNPQTSVPEDALFKKVAIAAAARLKEEHAIAGKTFMRQKYNMDSMYKNYYEPIFTEAMNVAQKDNSEVVQRDRRPALCNADLPSS